MLDYAAYIVENFSHDDSVARHAASALTAARGAGIPVIYVVPDRMQEQIHPLVAPVAGKTVFPGSWPGLCRIARVLPAARIPELGGQD